MAAKKTNWGGAVAFGGILLVVGWYLLHRKKPAGGGGASYGGGSGLPGLGGRPTGGSPTGGGGGGGAIPLNGLFRGNPLKSWINRILNQGYANAAQLNVSSDYIPGLGVSPDLSIAQQPMQLFDVNQLAQSLPGFDTSQISPTDLNLDTSLPYQPFDWGGSNPNDFLVTQDIQQPADLSSYGIDPNYGSDQVPTQDFFNAADLSSYLDAQQIPIQSAFSYNEFSNSGSPSQDLNPADYSFA